MRTRLMPLMAAALNAIYFWAFVRPGLGQFASREERFLCTFPAQPKVTETT